MTTLRTVDKDNVHIPPADTCVEVALANVAREAFEQEGDLFLLTGAVCSEFKEDILLKWEGRLRSEDGTKGLKEKRDNIRSSLELLLFVLLPVAALLSSSSML